MFATLKYPNVTQRSVSQEHAFIKKKKKKEKKSNNPSPFFRKTMSSSFYSNWKQF